MRLREFLKRAAVRPPVVVTQGDEVALGIVRDLSREGVPILVMGPDRHGPAFRSRLCAAVTCSDPYLDEEAFVADLLALGEKLPQRPVLLPAHDDYAAVASRHKAQLESSFVVPVPAWEHMQALADKEQQVLLASRLHIETPVTAFIRNHDDVLAAAKSVPFPAVLKSSVPMELMRRAGIKAFLVEAPEQLAQAYARFSSCGTIILQEVIPGDDGQLWLAACYHDARSQPLAIFTARKIRQHPRTFGIMRLGEGRWCAELADLTLRFLAAAHYQGLSDVEFKRDPRSGRFVFMEVNARQGFYGPLATASGLNLAHIAYQDSLGLAIERAVQRNGVRWANILRDTPDSLMEVWRGELGPREYFQSLAGVRVDGYLSFRDPWPGLCEVGELGWRLMKRVARRLMP